MLLTMDAPALLVLLSSSSEDNFSTTSSNVCDNNIIKISSSYDTLLC